MGQYFDDVHEGKESQFGDAPVRVADTPEIAALRADSAPESLLALGDALGRQLRYKEAIEAYDRYIEARPDDYRGYRRRAGRELAILRLREARDDLIRALERACELEDVSYRLGICYYLMGMYGRSGMWFERCWPLCGEELGIGVLYWHALGCLRQGESSPMLGHYSTGMQVGHHTSYEKVVRVLAGLDTRAQLTRALEAEPDDMEFDIQAYGLSVLARAQGDETEADRLLAAARARDAYWPCLAYLAVWQDTRPEDRAL